jgi:hypothetical protein
LTSPAALIKIDGYISLLVEECMRSSHFISGRSALAAALTLVVALAASATRGAIVAHWTFDEQGGSAYGDQTGNHNATVVTNGTGTVAPVAGQFGSGVSFNNASGAQAANNAYMTFPNLTELMGPAAGSYSVSVWAATANTLSNNPILADWGTAPAGTNRFIYWFSVQNATNNTEGQPRGQSRAANTPIAPANIDIFARNAPVNAAGLAMRHIVWTWDKSSHVLTTYLDGAVVDTFTSTAPSFDLLQSDSAVGTIGRKSDTNNYFNGSLDELWVVNQVLTPAEVESLRTSNTIPEPASVGLAGVAAALLLLRRRQAV